MATQNDTVRKNLETLMGEEVFNRFYIQLNGLLFGDSCSRGYTSYIPRQVSDTLVWLNKDDNTAKVEAFFAEPENQSTKMHDYYNAFKDMFIDHNEMNWIVYLGMKQDQGATIMMGAMSGTDVNKHLTRGLYGIWKGTFDSQERKSFLASPDWSQGRQIDDLKRKQNDQCVIS